MKVLVVIMFIISVKLSAFSQTDSLQQLADANLKRVSRTVDTTVEIIGGASMVKPRPNR